MPKIVFNKPPLSPNALLSKLKQQGMTIHDDESALKYLQHVGGFRLKPYWYPYQSAETKCFAPDTAFGFIVRKYEFDRSLRSIIFDSIERLEVAVRATIANRLAIRYGPHWFNSTIPFRDGNEWARDKMLGEIRRDIDKSKQKTYITSYYSKYHTPDLPPSWATAECLSFSFWSKIYKALADKGDRNTIAKKFRIDDFAVLESWLHSLSYLRNSVAHHERLINTSLSIVPKSYSAKDILTQPDVINHRATVFAAATVMNYMINSAQLETSLKPCLLALFGRYPDIAKREIGFPDDWATRPGWNE